MMANRFCTPWTIDCGDIAMAGQIVGRMFGPDDASPAQLRAIRELVLSAPQIAAALIHMLEATKYMETYPAIREARQEALRELAGAGIEPSYSARLELLAGASP